ncbi:ISAs1 family transposase [Streptosporangium roseum]|uniref:Transposase n=1 Tax=Streptosporangium roseum (strain ATCC 12428 / DSM 43021 / JCM 3005 / KCTC 9067 / NCIMB 10171 / NRRL 2505 / NI 9100) TaxID=479432 RepID=D2BC55_STRRD|nr:ISAs1 family transposase [Streptosporangium roseum]ACZ88078.1 putative transposase [Streptosporangium roseum DSM 43021]
MPVAPSSLINAVGREQIGQTNTDSSARLDLIDRFTLISDPRSTRGRRHCLASILAIVACATVAVGGDCLTAIEQWADNAPQHILADLHIWRDPFTGLHRPPSERTIRRVLAALDGDELDACLTTFLNRPPGLPAAETHDRLPAPASRRTEREARRAAHRSPTPAPGLLPAYAVDGKRLKGARHPDGGRVHLISLAAHLDATVHAQRQIPAKSSEIGALDTQRASARLLIEEHHAHYVMIVKANQPTLHATAITALTGTDTDFAAVTHRETHRGHGRTEYRILRTAPADGIDFPYAAQVFRVLRHRGGLDGIRHSKEVCYGITDLTARQAGPAHLAAYVRGHWKAIENGVHHVRDVTFAEDACQARTATLPRALAAFRNLATGTLRRAGHVNIAHARREHGYDHQRVLDLFNLGPK